MKNFQNPAVAKVFEAYPGNIRKKMLFLRQLVFDVASETEGVDSLEETLKWGEPSYISKSGSTVRMDWKPKNPTQYAMFFHCQTKLVDTFKEVYGEYFKFEGNRAIIFDLYDEIPVDKLKNCLALALTYHSKKNLPLLGA